MFNVKRHYCTDYVFSITDFVQHVVPYFIQRFGFEALTVFDYYLFAVLVCNEKYSNVASNQTFYTFLTLLFECWKIGKEASFMC